MPNKSNEWGTIAENLATEYLITNGYSICERNKRFGHYEIDIIAMKGTLVCFIEVKARNGKYSEAIDAVDNKKINRIIRSADDYMRNLNEDLGCRFDIITFNGTPDNYQMEHIEDAFIPPLGRTGGR